MSNELDTPKRNFTEVWKQQFPSGHFIEFNCTDENEEIIIFHCNGSKIQFRPNGDIELFASNNLWINADDTVAVKCKRFVLDAEGGEEHKSDYHNHIKFNADVDIEISGTVRQTINRDYLLRVEGKHNIKSNDLVQDTKGNHGIYCANLKFGNEQRPVNSITTHSKANHDFIESEVCTKTNKNNGNYSFNCPGRWNVNIGENAEIDINKDLNIRVKEKENRKIGKKARHKYEDELHITSEKDFKLKSKKDIKIQADGQIIILSKKGFSLNILSGGIAEVVCDAILEFSSSLPITISSATNLVLESSNVDITNAVNSKTPIENIGIDEEEEEDKT